MIPFAGLNKVTEVYSSHDEGPTREALESKIIGIYENALKKQKDGDYKGAIQLYTEALVSPQMAGVDRTVLRSDDVRSNTMLWLKFLINKNIALICVDDGLYGDSLHYFSEATLIYPTDVTVWLNYTDAANENDDIALAINCAQSAIRIEKKCWPAIDRLCTLLFTAGNFGMCKDVVAYALSLDPTYVRGKEILKGIRDAEVTNPKKWWFREVRNIPQPCTHKHVDTQLNINAKADTNKINTVVNTNIIAKKDEHTAVETGMHKTKQSRLYDMEFVDLLRERRAKRARRAISYTRRESQEHCASFTIKLQELSWSEVCNELVHVYDTATNYADDTASASQGRSLHTKVVFDSASAVFPLPSERKLSSTPTQINLLGKADSAEAKVETAIRHTSDFCTNSSEKKTIVSSDAAKRSAPVKTLPKRSCRLIEKVKTSEAPDLKIGKNENEINWNDLLPNDIMAKLTPPVTIPTAEAENVTVGVTCTSMDASSRPSSVPAHTDEQSTVSSTLNTHDDIGVSAVSLGRVDQTLANDTPSDSPDNALRSVKEILPDKRSIYTVDAGNMTAGKGTPMFLGSRDIPDGSKPTSIDSEVSTASYENIQGLGGRGFVTEIVSEAVSEEVGAVVSISEKRNVREFGTVDDRIITNVCASPPAFPYSMHEMPPLPHQAHIANGTDELTSIPNQTADVMLTSLDAVPITDIKTVCTIEDIEVSALDNKRGNTTSLNNNQHTEHDVLVSLPMEIDVEAERWMRTYLAQINEKNCSFYVLGAVFLARWGDALVKCERGERVCSTSVSLPHTNQCCTTLCNMTDKTPVMSFHERWHVNSKAEVAVYRKRVQRLHGIIKTAVPLPCAQLRLQSDSLIRTYTQQNVSACLFTAEIELDISEENSGLNVDNTKKILDLENHCNVLISAVRLGRVVCPRLRARIFWLAIRFKILVGKPNEGTMYGDLCSTSLKEIVKMTRRGVDKAYESKGNAVITLNHAMNDGVISNDTVQGKIRQIMMISAVETANKYHALGQYVHLDELLSPILLVNAPPTPALVGTVEQAHDWSLPSPDRCMSADCIWDLATMLCNAYEETHNYKFLYRLLHAMLTVCATAVIPSLLPASGITSTKTLKEIREYHRQLGRVLRNLTTHLRINLALEDGTKTGIIKVMKEIITFAIERQQKESLKHLPTAIIILYQLCYGHNVPNKNGVNVSIQSFTATTTQTSRATQPSVANAASSDVNGVLSTSPNTPLAMHEAALEYLDRFHTLLGNLRVSYHSQDEDFLPFAMEELKNMSTAPMCVDGNHPMNDEKPYLQLLFCRYNVKILYKSWKPTEHSECKPVPLTCKAAIDILIRIAPVLHNNRFMLETIKPFIDNCTDLLTDDSTVTFMEGEPRGDSVPVIERESENGLPIPTDGANCTIGPDSVDCGLEPTSMNHSFTCDLSDACRSIERYSLGLLPNPPTPISLPEEEQWRGVVGLEYLQTLCVLAQRPIFTPELVRKLIGYLYRDIAVTRAPMNRSWELIGTIFSNVLYRGFYGEKVWATMGQQWIQNAALRALLTLETALMHEIKNRDRLNELNVLPRMEPSADIIHLSRQLGRLQYILYSRRNVLFPSSCNETSKALCAKIHDLNSCILRLGQGLSDDGDPGDNDALKESVWHRYLMAKAIRKRHIDFPQPTDQEEEYLDHFYHVKKSKVVERMSHCYEPLYAILSVLTKKLSSETSCTEIVYNDDDSGKMSGEGEIGALRVQKLCISNAVRSRVGVSDTSNEKNENMDWNNGASDEVVDTPNKSKSNREARLQELLDLAVKYGLDGSTEKNHESAIPVNADIDVRAHECAADARIHMTAIPASTDEHYSCIAVEKHLVELLLKGLRECKNNTHFHKATYRECTLLMYSPTHRDIELALSNLKTIVQKRPDSYEFKKENKIWRLVESGEVRKTDPLMCALEDPTISMVDRPGSHYIRRESFVDLYLRAAAENHDVILLCNAYKQLSGMSLKYYTEINADSANKGSGWFGVTGTFLMPDAIHRLRARALSLLIAVLPGSVAVLEEMFGKCERECAQQNVSVCVEEAKALTDVSGCASATDSVNMGGDVDMSDMSMSEMENTFADANVDILLSTSTSPEGPVPDECNNRPVEMNAFDDTVEAHRNTDALAPIATKIATQKGTPVQNKGNDQLYRCYLFCLSVIEAISDALTVSDVQPRVKSMLERWRLECYKFMPDINTEWLKNEIARENACALEAKLEQLEAVCVKPNTDVIQSPYPIEHTVESTGNCVQSSATEDQPIFVEGIHNSRDTDEQQTKDLNVNIASTVTAGATTLTISTATHVYENANTPNTNLVGDRTDRGDKVSRYGKPFSLLITPEEQLVHVDDFVAKELPDSIKVLKRHLDPKPKHKTLAKKSVENVSDHSHERFKTGMVKATRTSARKTLHLHKKETNAS
eukprot:CFRG4073T1